MVSNFSKSSQTCTFVAFHSFIYSFIHYYKLSFFFIFPLGVYFGCTPCGWHYICHVYLGPLRRAFWTWLQSTAAVGKWAIWSSGEFSNKELQPITTMYFQSELWARLESIGLATVPFLLSPLQIICQGLCHSLFRPVRHSRNLSGVGTVAAVAAMAATLFWP